MCILKMNRKELCFKHGNKLNWEKIGYGFQKKSLPLDVYAFEDHLTTSNTQTTIITKNI